MNYDNFDHKQISSEVNICSLSILSKKPFQFPMPVRRGF